MLGVVTGTSDDPADQLLREFGDEIGASARYAKTRVGVYFGEPGVTADDPFFGGQGPARTGCTACGRCMVGCPVGAKNTLLTITAMAERAVSLVPGNAGPEGQVPLRMFAQGRNPRPIRPRGLAVN